MKSIKSLSLVGLVTGSMLFSGCQAVEDRVGDVLNGRVLPFHQQPQQQNNNNQQGNVSYGGMTGSSFNSGEVKEIGAFGETYACLALNRIGNESIFPQRGSFINKTFNFKAGDGAIHFYVESSASFGDYRLQMFDKNTGRELFTVTQPSNQPLTTSRFYWSMDKSHIGPGDYSLCLSGKSTKGYTGIPFVGSTLRLAGDHKKVIAIDLKVGN